MSEKYKVKLTREECQFLFRASILFKMPRKLGEDRDFTDTERSVAHQEVGELFMELKASSPYYQEKSIVVFGEKGWWKKLEKVEGGDQFQLLDPGTLVKLTFDENMLSGVAWLLLVALHPSSDAMVCVGVQQENIWPLAQKLRLDKMLEKDIELKDAPHRRLDLTSLPEERGNGDSPAIRKGAERESI